MSHINSSNAGFGNSNNEHGIVKKRKRGPGRPKISKRREITNHPKSLLDLFQLFPIFDRICSFLGIAEIRSLTRTCTQLSRVYHNLLRTQWNVDTQLRRFVKDPYEFRSQLGRYDALVAGSFAVQYFERVVWEEAATDVFVEDKFGADFVKYLSEAEGYRLSSTEWLEAYLFDIEEKVETYVKCTTGSKIRVIYTHDIPIQTILMSSYTTAVVNFITWNKAYAIFPLSTFVHHKAYLLKPLDDRIGPYLAKYSRRGWRSQEILYPREAGPSHPIRPRRRIGDCFTWMIPFDTGNIEWSKTPEYVLEHALFEIERHIGDGLGQQQDRYEIEAMVYWACVLKYRYTQGNTYSLEAFWQWIGWRLDSLTRMELTKMPPETRPPFFTEAMRSSYKLYKRNGQFEPPPDWTYVDDEMPRWYEKYAQEQRELRKKGALGPRKEHEFPFGCNEDY